MNVDLHCIRFEWAGSPEGIGPGVADLARRAEAMGIRTMSVMDHFFQMERMAPAEDPMLECYTALGYLAGCTERLRLRSLVTGVTYRHPGLLAKIVTTLDVLSGGRAELGIGAAWYEREHRALGVPFPPPGERLARLEEAVQICLQMWSDDDGPYHGTYYQLEETLCRPAPVSRPRPRILIGGGGERKTLRLVAKYADACNFFGGPADVAHKIGVLRQHCEAIGRDPAEIEVTALFREFSPSPSSDEILSRAEAFAEVGVSTLITGAIGDDPAGWLEEHIAPLMKSIADIEPAAL
ncbi:MAG TPA: LLM class F420-dependent oxidoreductase [Acidimicrobiales bacterium]|nr:LLM class F420-dependent oxidoreductase [Acidimicrobiales bacterium]